MTKDPMVLGREAMDNYDAVVVWLFRVANARDEKDAGPALAELDRFDQLTVVTAMAMMLRCMAIAELERIHDGTPTHDDVEEMLLALIEPAREYGAADITRKVSTWISKGETR